MFEVFCDILIGSYFVRPAKFLGYLCCMPSRKSILMTDLGGCQNSGPFWIPIIIRSLIFRVPKKGP